LFLKNAFSGHSYEILSRKRSSNRKTYFFLEKKQIGIFRKNIQLFFSNDISIFLVLFLLAMKLMFSLLMTEIKAQIF